MKRVLISLLLVTLVAGVASATLVAHYKFDGDMTDSSENGYDATASGNNRFLWEAGVDGGSAINNHVAGSNLTVSVPAAAFSTISTQATFAFWTQLTYLSDSSLQCGHFFSGTSGGTALAYARPYKQGSGVYPNITMLYNVGTSTSYAWWSNFDDTLGPREEWGHVAITFDAEAGTRSIYVNGELIVAQSSTAVLPIDTIAGIDEFRIFNDVSEASWNSFHGKMDDFRIYDNALTQAEVQALVPEPTTIALLSLGVLALIRRKK